ncbi:MAG TPA: AAA family ATPase [Pedobacter sp.]|nr:AAA family ATPase [Pedobacter sp.]
MIEISEFIDETEIKEVDTPENVLKLTGGVSAWDLYQMKVMEIPKLLGELLPKVGLVLLAGSSDTGKSMFNRDLILHLVLGFNSFIEMPFASGLHRRAAIVSTEDDDLAIAWLLQKQVNNPKIDIEIALKNLDFYFDSEDIIQRLERNLKQRPVDVILLDTLGDILDNPNDNGEVRKKMADFKRLATTYRCLVIIMHHTSKRTEGLAPSKSSILGGSSIEQKVRLALEFRNDTADPNFKHLSVLKGNYLSKEFKGSSFKLEMNEQTFNFTNTGERVLFDDLAIQTDEQTKRVPLLKANEVDNDTHLVVLEKVFKGGLKPKLSDLNIRLSNQYETYFSTKFGERRVRQYLDYLINDIGLISKSGKDKSPNAYYYLATDDIANDTA